MRDECKMCHATMITDEGADPTEICHDCAHARVDFLERRIAKVEGDCKTSAMQAKMAIERQLELEEALVLIGECTACPLCKNRALDALASGASMRKKKDQCAHKPMLEWEGRKITGTKRCIHCGLNEAYWNR